ncbi:type IV secretion system DNA-binding domain-containing protein [Phytohabitans sp. ZYX-F-186]|uniref:Type IV secretion system DNA-binding domain-containing protein n=1 Tax=Phytohabitans maris TaxID=3071409 RepID=A0ABU0ZJ50_9ACTN|nr:type IV secretion system DNA-binding domain-containing protein [Phytohabitans sp. ZYX-F-186]MDQ7905977.1 type IV secretion system DNA-binding domain-containing protein [Phytohabitans sp. ZYX-F-186]
MSRRHPSPTTAGAAAPAALRRAPARLRLVPPDSPRRQAVKALGVAPIGEPVLIGLSPADARHHLHVPGPTGTGKSTLLLNLALADARAGRGLAVFDPKGDLVRDLLDRLPPGVAGRLVLIDPDERQAPPALNLFDLGSDPETVADQLVGVMAKVWAQYWGPRTDDLARHAVLTLAHQPDATLADLPLLLADAAYRRWVLAWVRRRADPVEYGELAAFWAWYDELTPAQASVQAGPLLSKLRAVLSRRFAAQLFGVGASTFRLTEVLDGGALLVRLPPTLGEDTVRLVGSLLLAALLGAANGRADLPEADRLDASLVLDEAHTFLHLPVGVDNALATARALHVSLVLAHQHLGQLSANMFAALDANARNKVFFSLPPKDARDLAHHMAPYFEPEDLMRRDAYGIVCRLVIDGADSEPFSLHTRPAPPVVPGRADVLRAAARARGLSTSERAALAQARRLGPAARTGPTNPTGNGNGPAVNPTQEPTDPTGPTGGRVPPAGPTSGPAGPGVQPPPAARVRPPTPRKRRKRP